MENLHERDRQVAEILVTKRMIDAGMEELAEHHYAGDIPYMLECVFRSMAYASDPASLIKDSK